MEMTETKSQLMEQLKLINKTICDNSNAVQQAGNLLSLVQAQSIIVDTLKKL